MPSCVALFVLVALISQCSCSEIQTVNLAAANEYQSLNPEEDTSSIRKKASVRPFYGDVRSYSGFLTVEPKYDAKLFYWFFECVSNPSEAPLLLWLFGVVGRSSMLSVFEENGPYILIKDKVYLHEPSWTTKFNVLYIDSTVATGYSVANSTAAIPTTTDQAAAHLYKALKEFLRIYDAYDKSPVYLGAESTASKIIVSLGARIHEENERSESKIPLKQLFLGAGFVDSVNQQFRAEFLYQTGVVDPVAKEQIVSHEDAAYLAIEEGNYGKANSHRRAVDKKIKRAGYASPIDVAQPDYDLSSFKNTVKFFKSKKVRQQLHANNVQFQDRPVRVLRRIRDGLQTSSAQELANLVLHYGVLMYTGQYDMAVPTRQYDQVIVKLKWEGVADFIGKSRLNLYVKDKLAGYYKCHKNLCQVMVRQANHFVARTQPYVTLQALLLPD